MLVTLVRKMSLAFVACAALVSLPAFSADFAAPSNEIKRVVLVHGAFADGSSWDKVIPILQAKGLDVVAVQNPLTSLADDIAATKRAINEQPGRVILVGHSWGGVVITEAGASEKVAGLVYVTAFAPSEGESVAEMNKDYPPPPGFSYLVKDAHGFLKMSAKGMAQGFAQDLPRAQTDVMASTQGALQENCLHEKAMTAAWRTKPSWFIVTNRDLMIQPQLQINMAKKISATTTELQTSHVPMQSDPQAVARVILEAVAKAR